MFSRRCNSDAEFRLIQCCTTCNQDKEALDYDAIARALVYVNSTDAYEPNREWTCDGRFPQIAFRACRKSCGYCDFSIIEYTLENALNSCKKKDMGESHLDAWDISRIR
ncbi:unnamed protein product [Cylicocyclus nassatus]|uniref:Uncharacterized protein n=1 Tax=Cylicocyclus nassatus TaxID=53992 RepID=A0AA36HEN9_CYLNA|nr:unnamed protein product [Cylicocyclus nassatus]